MLFYCRACHFNNACIAICTIQPHVCDLKILPGDAVLSLVSLLTFALGIGKRENKSIRGNVFKCIFGPVRVTRRRAHYNNLMRNEYAFLHATPIWPCIMRSLRKGKSMLAVVVKWHFCMRKANIKHSIIQSQQKNLGWSMSSWHLRWCACQICFSLFCYIFSERRAAICENRWKPTSYSSK